MLFNSCYSAEFFCKFCKSFFFCFFCHSVIHISPFKAFAFCCMKKILSRVAKFAKSLKPKFSVFLFVFCSL